MKEGTEGSATCVVGEQHLASALAAAPGETYPAVFATTQMIALMELAAGRALQGSLKPGELSVGVVVDVTHTAATLPGATVTARARFVRQEGKLYVFEVRAEDQGGEIGRGVHKRAIVETARLIEGARRRA